MIKALKINQMFKRWIKIYPIFALKVKLNSNGQKENNTGTKKEDY